MRTGPRSKRSWASVVLAASTLIALAATSMPSASSASATAATCSNLGNFYDLPTRQLVSCGFTLLPESSSTADPYGGKVYSYVLGGGTIEFHVPPGSFAADNAPLSQLKYYGLPPRPPASSAQSLTTWKSDFGKAQFQSPPQTLIVAPIVSNDTSAHWSGFMATSSSSNYYTFVNTQYVQPSNTVSNCNNPGTNGISIGTVWTGLGGWNTGYIAQTGTDFGSNIGGNGQFWFEFYPSVPDVNAGGQVTLNQTASPGDIVEAGVTYNGGVNYSMYLYDITNNKIYSASMNAPTGFSPDGTTAEFIVERPTVEQYLLYYPANLPNFGRASFNYSSVGAGSNIQYLPHFSHVQMDMVLNSDLLATPTPGILGSSGNFPVNYIGCR